MFTLDGNSLAKQVFGDIYAVLGNRALFGQPGHFSSSIIFYSQMARSGTVRAFVSMLGQLNEFCRRREKSAHAIEHCASSARCLAILEYYL